ncbi:hypothetical protein WKV44_00400 [Spirochaetia bacterium 38H-sp]|uniref:Uncharacterized protein n=1 Tax=Rarispira pelagica TaxID=3141764 RepID=A0ABU9UA03_9SPIR
MKRNIILLSLVVLFSFTSLFSQEKALGFDSLQSLASFGIFTNEFDAMSDVNVLRSAPGFSSLDKTYIFAGVANSRQGTASTNTDTGPLFLAGYFSPIKMSMGLSFDSSPTISTINNGTSSVTATKTVGTTNYIWESSITENKYTLQSEDMNISGGFILPTGPILLGAGINFSYKSNTSGIAIDTYAQNNGVETVKYYRDAAGASAEPDPVLDYTHITTKTSPDTVIDTEVTVPVYIPLGEVVKGLGISAQMSWKNRNLSSSIEEKYQVESSSTFAGATINNNLIEDYVNTLGTNIEAVLEMNPIFGKNSKNRLEIYGNVSFELPIPSEYKNITSTITLDASANASDFDQTEVTQVRKGLLKYSAEAGASHYFYYDFDNWAVLGFKPVAGLSIAYQPTDDYYMEKQITINRSDGATGASDGTWDDAVDSIAVTENRYYNNNDGYPLEIRMPLSLASSFKWKQKDWIFGLTFSNRVGVTPIYSITTDKQDIMDSVSTTYTGDQTQPALDSTDISHVSSSSVTTSLDWSFDYTNTIILNFYLPNDIRLDVLSVVNLLEINNLIIQCIIPLP